MQLDFLGLDFLGLAYLVTGLILAWDYIAPRLRLERVRRAIAQRIRRAQARKDTQA
jgi:hypothetical protein